MTETDETNTSEEFDDFEDFEDFDDLDDADDLADLELIDGLDDETDDLDEQEDRPRQPISDADALTVARAIVNAISDKKGEKIILSDLRPVSVIAEFFVIGEAASARQINAIIDHIREEMREIYGLSPLRTEGVAESGWVLLDYGDIIVHLFSPDVRSYYDLEGLWREAPVLMRMQ